MWPMLNSRLEIFFFVFFIVISYACKRKDVFLNLLLLFFHLISRTTILRNSNFHTRTHQNIKLLDQQFV